MKPPDMELCAGLVWTLIEVSECAPGAETLEQAANVLGNNGGPAAAIPNALQAKAALLLWKGKVAFRTCASLVFRPR